MAADDKKPPSLALLALGRSMKPKKAGGDGPEFDDVEGEDDAPERDEGLEMAMQDFIDALESKDTQGMSEAFKHAAAMCGDADY